MKTQNAWTLKALYFELINQGFEIRKTQFYEWLHWSSVRTHKNKMKTEFNERDRFKLLKFAEFKTRYPRLSLKEVSILLSQDLENNSGAYPQ